MTENKTKKNNSSAEDFLNGIEDTKKRSDSFEILNIMTEISSKLPVLWGDSIVGFGDYHYKYGSGREGEWFLIGFSPRKQNITIYLMSGFENFSGLLEQLGKYKTGKGCLYIKTLDDVNINVLKQLMIRTINWLTDYSAKNQNINPA